MCQNNMYHSVYDGSFESKFGLAFRCPECITLAIKSEDGKMSRNKKLFKISKTIIDTLEYISSEEEVHSEKSIFDDDTVISSTSESIKNDNKAAVIVIYDDHVEDKYNNTSESNDEQNQYENISKSNDEVNETAKDSSVNEQCEESYVIHDNDDENQLTILEKKNESVNSFYESVSMMNFVYGNCFPSLIRKGDNFF